MAKQTKNKEVLIALVLILVIGMGTIIGVKYLEGLLERNENPVSHEESDTSSTEETVVPLPGDDADPVTETESSEENEGSAVDPDGGSSQLSEQPAEETITPTEQPAASIEPRDDSQQSYDGEDPSSVTAEPVPTDSPLEPDELPPF